MASIQTAEQHDRRAVIEKDMTKGSPMRLLVSFMIPMIIGNVFQQFYNMVDSMVVGHFVGADALAAVGATGSLTWLLFSLCNGLGNGIGIIISQYFGAGDLRAVRKTIGNAFYIVGASGIIMGTIGYNVCRSLLILLKTPDNILDQSAAYMQIMCIGVIFVSLYNCVSAILRGLGDSKTPLYFLIVASILNVIMDLVFVVHFHWDVIGVAVATIISQFISGAGSLLFAMRKNPLFRLTKDSFRPDPVIMKNTIRLGVPLALQSSMIAFSCVILQGVVNSFGSSVVAAFTATSRIEQLVQQPYMSLQTAISTYTGQNIGARNEERVNLGKKHALILLLIFTGIFFPVAQLGGRFLMTWFVTDETVIGLGTQALRITSIFYIGLGTIYVYRGMLNGSGDALFSLINGITEMCGRIFFPRPLTMFPVIGVWGIWLGTGLTWSLVAAVCLIRFHSGAWRPERRYRGRKSTGQAGAGTGTETGADAEQQAGESAAGN